MRRGRGIQGGRRRVWGGEGEAVRYVTTSARHCQVLLIVIATGARSRETPGEEEEEEEEEKRLNQRRKKD